MTPARPPHGCESCGCPHACVHEWESCSGLWGCGMLGALGMPSAACPYSASLCTCFRCRQVLVWCQCPFSCASPFWHGRCLYPAASCFSPRSAFSLLLKAGSLRCPVPCSSAAQRSISHPSLKQLIPHIYFWAICP